MKFNLQKMISGAVCIMESALYKTIFGIVCMGFVVSVAVIYCADMIKMAWHLENPVTATLENGLDYQVCEDHVKITDCNESAEGEMIIPVTIEGLPVTSIEGFAFSACSSLTSITIPDGVAHIGMYAFSGCDSLTAIHVNSENQYYMDMDDVLFSKDQKTLLQYPIGKPEQSYSIPDGVTSIEDFAFSNCSSLESVVIPDSVTSIGDYAFYGCFHLSQNISAIRNRICNNPPSYEKIRKKITAYFDNFYAQNRNFSVRSFAPEELTNTIGTWVNGYFYNEQLVWMQLETFGDMQERFSNYYVINSELTYMITNLYQHSTEKSTEMFIIDGVIWVYDGNDTLVLYQESDAEMEIYEMIRKELANDNSVYFNNDGENNHENRFDQLKTDYFTNYYLYHNTYQQENYPCNDFDATAFLENGILKKICLQIYEGAECKKYNYYILDKDIIYIIAFHQQYKNENGDIIFGKSFYEQYYMMDHEKIMEYNCDTNNLEENLCMSFLSEYFNDAETHLWQNLKF